MFRAAAWLSIRCSSTSSRRRPSRARVSALTCSGTRSTSSSPASPHGIVNCWPGARFCKLSSMSGTVPTAVGRTIWRRTRTSSPRSAISFPSAPRSSSTPTESTTRSLTWPGRNSSFPLPTLATRSMRPTPGGDRCTTRSTEPTRSGARRCPDRTTPLGGRLSSAGFDGSWMSSSPWQRVRTRRRFGIRSWTGSWWWIRPTELARASGTPSSSPATSGRIVHRKG